MGWLDWLFGKKPQSSSKEVSGQEPKQKKDNRREFDDFLDDGDWGLDFYFDDEPSGSKVKKPGKPEEDKQKEAKQKGDEFEKYILKKLSQNKYLTIKEVTADKGFEVGVWVEANTHPDFVVEFNWNGRKISKLFAVECKWRKSLFRDCFCWASWNQIQRYEKFSSERQMPVFLALGLGGSPSDPEKLYIVPLEEVREDVKEFRGEKQGMITVEKLNNSKLGYFKSKASGFFFDCETGVLR